MNIAILTEGGKDKGFGHVARCSSIYQAFEYYSHSVRFIINGDDSIKSILNNIDYELYNWIDDLSIIDDFDIVIIDSYLADFSIYNEISTKGKLLVSIDDNNRFRYPSGIIVNGTLDVTNMNYPIRDDILYLTGNNFVPLRKDFWEISNLAINDDIVTVLITMGGNDLRNLTPKLLNLLNNSFPNLNKKIIISDSFDNVDEIKKFKNDSVEFIYSPNSSEMLHCMFDVDLAISASGQTLYELACVGVPTISIGIIENQENNIKNWLKTGFIEYAGCWNNENLLNNILNKMDYLSNKDVRFDKNLKGINAIDGKGSLRIVKGILNEYYIQNSNFREIKSEDCLKIFELANDDDVRKNSFNSDKIKLEDHINWFDNIIHDVSTKFYVLEFDDDIIGQLRFDFDEEYPVISISLNKKYRGLGLSKYLLSQGFEFLEEFKKIVAYIKKDNLTSISFFKSMGFKKEKEVIIKDCPALKFVKE